MEKETASNKMTKQDWNNLFLILGYAAGAAMRKEDPAAGWIGQKTWELGRKLQALREQQK